MKACLLALFHTLEHNMCLQKYNTQQSKTNKKSQKTKSKTQTQQLSPPILFEQTPSSKVNLDAAEVNVTWSHTAPSICSIRVFKKKQNKKNEYFQ